MGRFHFNLRDFIWKWVYVLGLVVCAVGGTYLIAKSESTFPQSYVDLTQKKLRITQVELAELKDLLLEYRKVHGRLPTNDEGLAALDGFETTFPIRSTDRVARHVYINETQQRRLADFRKKHSRFPQDEIEFFKTIHNESGVPSDLTGTMPSDMLTADRVITHSCYAFTRTPAGILTLWHIPYTYENRRGVDAELFRSSPATWDKDRLYSILVDQDVYVYDSGGIATVSDNENASLLLKTAQKADFWRRVVGAGVLLPIPVFLVLLAGKGSFWRGPIFFFVSTLILLSYRPFYTRCHMNSIATGILCDATFQTGKEALLKGKPLKDRSAGAARTVEADGDKAASKPSSRPAK